MEETKKMKCYERLIYKQSIHVSGLCSPQFLSYLPKRFTHLCRALYIRRRHIGVPFWCTNIAAGNKQNIWSSLFLLKLFLFTRELAWTWNCYSAENQEQRLFLTRQHSYFGVSHFETRKFKLLYFRNEICYGNVNLYKDLLFVYLQPSVLNKNS